ncbi:ABC-type phospholipid transporter, permease protein [Candidatus Gastranaerophilus sp. (ex Termes propinquus)]|nr:ABC-type phospholipid transporter, permease protein [Candidatus Gastranaerophilus sp. (ex Termes propinquus)]
MKYFLVTLGNLGKDFVRVMKYVLLFKYKWREILVQCSRFGFDSLPITLTIVGMTAIIIAMQIAPELAKQGLGDYMGMLSSLVMIREMGPVMAGFAIISMIGSSYASELASMSVTDQISAMKVLKVDPIEYLVLPRFLAGVIMMPVIVVITSTIGLVIAGWVSYWTAEISLLNYINSLWRGLWMRDIFIALLKSSVFGGTIAIISCSCGYSTRGGAKDVGLATTRAVVWSFIAMAIWDYIFAVLFYLWE